VIFQSADLPSLILFVVLLAGLLFSILKVLFEVRADSRVVFGVAAYLFVFSDLVLFGAVRTHLMPLAPILLLSAGVGAIWLAFGSVGTRIFKRYTFAVLLGFQSFRFLLELILHHWAERGTIPSTMSWNGQNYDVIAGLVSLVAIPFLNRSRTLVWGVQLIGFGLLLNVMRVAVMSSPFWFAWKLESPLQVIMYYPYALIAPLCVGTALCGHLLVFRKLLSKPDA
jgi:hypothetical protein